MMQVVQISFVVQRQIPRVQTLLDHRVSPVAPQGDRCPCCSGRAFLQWMVSLFCSTTEWWLLPLCCGRYAQCQTVHFTGLVIDMPVIVHVKVVDKTVVAQRQLAWVQPSRPLSFSICSSLTGCSMSVARSSIFGCSR